MHTFIVFFILTLDTLVHLESAFLSLSWVVPDTLSTYLTCSFHYLDDLTYISVVYLDGLNPDLYLITNTEINLITFAQSRGSKLSCQENGKILQFFDSELEYGFVKSNNHYYKNANNQTFPCLAMDSDYVLNIKRQTIIYCFDPITSYFLLYDIIMASSITFIPRRIKLDGTIENSAIITINHCKCILFDKINGAVCAYQIINNLNQIVSNVHFFGENVNQYIPLEILYSETFQYQQGPGIVHNENRILICSFISTGEILCIKGNIAIDETYNITITNQINYTSISSPGCYPDCREIQLVLYNDNGLLAFYDQNDNKLTIYNIIINDNSTSLVLMPDLSTLTPINSLGFTVYSQTDIVLFLIGDTAIEAYRFKESPQCVNFTLEVLTSQELMISLTNIFLDRIVSYRIINLPVTGILQLISTTPIILNQSYTLSVDGSTISYIASSNVATEVIQINGTFIANNICSITINVTPSPVTPPCTDYTYIDSNNQLQCVDTCIILPYTMIIHQCKQCVSTCATPVTCTSDIMQYAFNPYCLKKCPMTTINNKETLICNKINDNHDLVYVPDHITQWIHDMSEKELIEFGKNDTIIINENYVVDIYNTTDGKPNSSLNNITNELNLSSISFPECAKLLKDHYSIPDKEPLIVIKIELDNENLITNQIEYEIYSFKGINLDLSICSNTTIVVDSTIKTDDRINWELALNLSLQGIDIFNTSDPFFNDYCYPYTTTNSTDVLVEDRRNDFYPNISLCQPECKYKSINYTAMRVECDCTIQTEINTTLDEPTLADQFIDSFSSSNIEVVTCYKLLSDFKHLIKNIAFWLYSAFILMQISMVILYGCHNYKSLRGSIVKENRSESDQPKESPPKRKNSNNKNSENTKQSNEHSNHEINSHTKIMIKRGSMIQTVKGPISPRKTGIAKRLMTTKTLSTFEYDNTPHEIKENQRRSIISPTKNNQVTKEIQSNKTKEILQTFQSGEIITLNTSIPKRTKQFGSLIMTLPKENEATHAEHIYKQKSFEHKHHKIKHPVNTFSEAVKYDERTYLQMFWDILREKDLILNTIAPLDQYQLTSLKIITCIFSISFDFSFNALFYTIELVSTSYQFGGSRDFLISIPKTIYSVIASICSLWLLSYFSATNYTFRYFDVKKSHYLKFLKCVLMKHIIFFVLNLIIMGFFWYFAVTFCAVYHNNQINWLIDSCISMIIGIFLSIIVSILITVLRKVAINKRNRKLYGLCKFWQSL